MKLSRFEIDQITHDIGLDEDAQVTIQDVDAVSKEVDEDGRPLPPEEQNAVRQNNDDFGFIVGTESFKPVPPHNAIMGMHQYSSKMEGEQAAKASAPLPYCPVKIIQKPDGGFTYYSYITGPVRDVDTYIDLIDTLLVATEKDTYYIYIDSPGGLVSSGGIIASAIHHSRAEVFTVARGICASAAALIHSSAQKDHQLVGDFALMMYHMSSHFDFGTSTKILEHAKNQVRYVNECLLNKALADGHFTKEEFDKIQNGVEIFVPADEFRHRTGQMA